MEGYYNNETLFSKAISKGKGIKSKTIITHNIKEECFSNNCTIMVFAKSEKKNISKIYTPITLNILEKYEEKGDTKILQIILYIGLIIIILTFIILTIIFCYKKKKRKKIIDNTIEISTFDKNGLYSNDNQKSEKLFDDNSSCSKEENSLPCESEVYRKTSTGKNFDAPPTYIDLP